MPDPEALKNSPHVKYLWDDAEAPSDPVDLLVYRSNILGADQRITNTGGGNTSSKVMQQDPLTGEEVDVLWVKGSGGDLRTAKRENFSSLEIGEAPTAEVGLRGPRRPRPQDRGRGRAGGQLQALHVQPEPAGVEHRHPPARLPAGPLRRPHAPQRGDRGGGSQEQQRTHREDLRRPDGLGAVDAAGHGAGPAHARGAEEEPRSRRPHDGRPTGSSTGTTTPRSATNSRWTSSTSRPATSPTTTSTRAPSAEPSTARRGSRSARRRWWRSCPGCAAGLSQQQRFIGTVDSREEVLQFVNSQDAARLAELGTSCPDHFPADQDQAAVRRLGPDRRRPGQAQAAAGGRPREVPRGLQALLRGVQEARLAGHAGPEPGR